MRYGSRLSVKVLVPYIFTASVREVTSREGCYCCYCDGIRGVNEPVSDGGVHSLLFMFHFSYIVSFLDDHWTTLSRVPVGLGHLRECLSSSHPSASSSLTNPFFPFSSLPFLSPSLAPTSPSNMTYPILTPTQRQAGLQYPDVRAIFDSASVY